MTASRLDRPLGLPTISVSSPPSSTRKGSASADGCRVVFDTRRFVFRYSLLIQPSMLGDWGCRFGLDALAAFRLRLLWLLGLDLGLGLLLLSAESELESLLASLLQIL